MVTGPEFGLFMRCGPRLPGFLLGLKMDEFQRIVAEIMGPSGDSRAIERHGNAGGKEGPRFMRSESQELRTDFAILIMAAALRSTSSSVVAQQETEIRIAVCPCQSVPPHQQVPSA